MLKFLQVQLPKMSDILLGRKILDVRERVVPRSYLLNLQIPGNCHDPKSPKVQEWMVFLYTSLVCSQIH